MFTSLIGATILLSGFTAALPRPDSSIGEEVGVSAVDGVVMTDTAELASQSSAEAAAATQASSYGSSSNYGSNSGYGSSSNYGSSDSSSNYGSSNYGSSNYGSDSSNYGSGNSVDTAVWQTSTAEQSWTTSTAESWTSSTSAALSYSTPSYGSGSDSWNSNSGYDSCVQQCLASYGGLASATYEATATSGNSGSGATHTVIVAPTQGVLRFVPFALNASVGDTVMFMWGANTHTVTKSSELTPCNKTDDALFASGTHDKGFVFTEVINSTDTTFYYCGTPTHCQKGMFGIINPPNADSAASATSVGSMMQSITANNSDVQAYASYTSNVTSGTSASTWGTNFDMSSIPASSHADFVENVLFTRNFLAANPDVLTADGSIDLSSMASTPIMIPEDVSGALQNAAAAAPASTSAATVASSAAAPAVTSASSATSASNGAGSLTSSKMFVGVAALFATVFLL